MDQLCARILLLAALFLHGLAVMAQDGPWTEVRQGALQAHTEFLAGDLLEGRATGSRGHELAAAYVAAQFRQYGLQAGGAGDSYLQPVPLLEATVVLPGSSAVLRRDDGQIDFEYGQDFLPFADFLASASTLSAPLMFVGYGITAPELGYDDLADVDLQGRIAVILPHAPPRFTPAQRAYYGLLEQKYANLIRHGASGVVLVDAPLPDDRAETHLPWERRVAMSWAPQMRRLDSQGEPADVYRELKLRFMFSSDAAAKLFEGSIRNFEEVLTAAAESQPQGFALPGTLTLSATTGLRRTESSNVLGVLRGSDPKLRNEYVVLSAHLDHLGRGPAVNGDGIYNGLHDNAAGVAMLLETARVLGSLPTRPKRSIIFAAWTASEKGGLGAEHWLREERLSPEALIANIELDTPLPMARTTDLIALGAEQSSLGSFAATAFQAQNFRLSLEDTTRDLSLLSGDALAFVRHGVPSLSLKNGNQARNRKTGLTALKQAFLQNHLYQPSDEAQEASIDYAAAADLGMINLRLALAVADAAARPHWYRDSVYFKKFREPAP